MGSHGAAARLHDRDRRGQLHLGEAAFQLREIAPHDRLDVCVDDGRARPLELLHLRQHVRRKGEVDVRVPGADVLRDALLVLRIRVGVQEADRDGGDAVREQLVGRGGETFRFEWTNHASPKVDALGDLLPEVAGDERGRLVPVHVVEARVPEPADLEHVAESRRRDEADLRPRAGDHGVGRHRGGVREIPHLAGDDVSGLDHLGEPGADRVAVVVGGGKRLDDREAPGRIHRGNVGKRPSNIHADALHGALPRAHRSRSAAKRRPRDEVSTIARGSLCEAPERCTGAADSPRQRQARWPVYIARV